VKLLRWSGGLLLVVSMIIGTLSDVPRQNTRLQLGEYDVLAADFHIHSFPLSWGLLSPWDTVIQARREGLDVIAMTPHNHTWAAKVGQWFSRISKGPIVLVGEEIHSTGYHVLALKIKKTIPWRQPASSAIDEVHRQGGVAIAAHPIASYSSAYDDEALKKLDDSEVVHPLALRDEAAAAELRQFFGRGRFTAIGDTDYHIGPMSPQVGVMGLCRTFVFVREPTEDGVIAALREGRTVVYDRDRVYGDPSLIQLAAKDGRLPKLALTEQKPSSLVLFSGVIGVLGLLAWCEAFTGRAH
jgi:predicted metal-dependent phosphoesterase TrpH